MPVYYTASGAELLMYLAVIAIREISPVIFPNLPCLY